jgi:hypothetical protein
VAQAIARGFYADVVFDEPEQARLEQIFPTGVCDYSLPDAGLPRFAEGNPRAEEPSSAR